MPHCPCKVAPWFPRVAFGLVLVAYGVNHYMNLTEFITFVKSPFPIEGSLAAFGTVSGLAAYVVPALQIVGGALFAVKQYGCISKTCILAALSGILVWASFGIIVGGTAAGSNMIPVIQFTVIMLMAYYMVKKHSSCCGSCAPSAPVMPH